MNSALGTCLLLAGLTSLAGAAPAPAAPDPFRMSVDSIGGPYSAVAIVPVARQGSSVIPVRDSILSPLFEGRWRSAGYRVIESDVAVALWTSASREVGGVFDPRTGRRDTLKVAVATRRWVSALRDSLGAQLIIRHEVRRVAATWERDRIRWDDIEWPTPKAGLLASLFEEARSGRFDAASIGVAISRADGPLLFENSAGIAPFHQLTKAGWVAYSIGEIMADTASVRSAVTRSVAPWLDRMPAATPEP